MIHASLLAVLLFVWLNLRGGSELPDRPFRDRDDATLPGGVSPSVAAFIAAHLRSVDDLQLLVALVNSTDCWWDTAGAGRELRLGPARAQEVLERFAASNLLEISVTNEVRYQFRPGTPQLRQVVTDCLAEFQSTPAAVVRAIWAGACRDNSGSASLEVRRDRR